MAVNLDIGPVDAINFDLNDPEPTTWTMDEYVRMVTERETDYEKLDNLPKIDGVTLIGNKSAEEIGIRPIGNSAILELFR